MTFKVSIVIPTKYALLNIQKNKKDCKVFQFEDLSENYIFTERTFEMYCLHAQQ